MGCRILTLPIAVLFGGLLWAFVQGGRDLGRLRAKSEAARYGTVYGWHLVDDAVAARALADAGWTHPRVPWVEVEEAHSIGGGHRIHSADVAGLHFRSECSYSDRWPRQDEMTVRLNGGPDLHCDSRGGPVECDPASLLEARQRAGDRLIQFRCRMERGMEPWSEQRLALELCGTRWNPPVGLSDAVRDLRGGLLRAGGLFVLLAALALGVELRVRSHRRITDATLPAAYRTPANLVVVPPACTLSRFIRARWWIWSVATVGLWVSLVLARANVPSAMSLRPSETADPWPSVDTLLR
jgi:hypothetical protein